MEVLEIFKKIAQIPHCSGETQELRDFIVEFARDCGYEVKIDKAGNILATCENPKLCLQAHYDMVCVGKAPYIEIIEKDGYLMAKNSSLGADNGIGLAYMLYFLYQKQPIEALFTNDEEIGLIGAFNLELKPKSGYLLNLDSEDENIYIGSAGGVDCEVEYPDEKETITGSLGRLEIKDLPGGHSGVDIDKNIPNAIIELIKRSAHFSEIRGGERRNSIPSNAWCMEVFEGDEEIEVFSKKYLAFLRKLPHGVLEYDFKYSVVSKSINFALIENNKTVFSLRANSNEKLQEVKEYITYKAKGAKISFSGEYPAWEPEENELAKKLKSISGREFKVIHAGLECGILKNKLGVEVASYGPIIEYPHSTRERVEIDSVYRVLDVIKKLIKEM
ncbi:MAG: aminoacyl-histidine dipeptidase [Epsilonproteobacteria bacterium]|nr:aminoacyl-histidine dipeptidase [Campylobacterota bacterium]